MSLINQMLRDLDARHGPAGHAQVSAWHGIGLVRPRRAMGQRIFTFTAWSLLAFFIFMLADNLVKHFSLAGTDPADTGAEWTPLLLPEPTPRSRPTGRRAAVLPGNSGRLEAVRRNENTVPVRPLRDRPAVTADREPAATVITAEKQQAAAAPMVASAALEPAVIQPPQPVRNQGPEQQAEHRFAQAQRALVEQNWQQAERLLNQALEVLPGHLEARTQLASLLVSRQANDAAEQLLGEGLAIDPHAGALAKPYAQLLAGRGALQAALEVLAEAHPDAETAALRAAILHRKGNHAGAADAYENALHEQPGQAVWWTGLAIAREHNQEPREALTAYRQAALLQLNEPVRQYVEQRIQALQITEGQ